MEEIWGIYMYSLKALDIRKKFTLASNIKKGAWNF